MYFGIRLLVLLLLLEVTYANKVMSNYLGTLIARLLVLLLNLEMTYASKGYDKLSMIAAIPAYVSKVLVGIAAVHV